jgi:hypothetical protein
MSKKTTLISLNNVKTIMKSSPDVTSVNNDVLFCVSKATVSLNAYY